VINNTQGDIMANIERGMREIEILTDYLNNVIITTGRPIDRDNHTLWKKFFHHYDNVDWTNMIGAMDLIKEHYPEAFKIFHSQAIADAREILSDQDNQRGRILDTRPHKNRAWKAAMAIREVVNTVNGLDIPNK